MGHGQNLVQGDYVKEEGPVLEDGMTEASDFLCYSDNDILENGFLFT
jgi:hypothetical protein